MIKKSLCHSKLATNYILTFHLWLSRNDVESDLFQHHIIFFSFYLYCDRISSFLSCSNTTINFIKYSFVFCCDSRSEHVFPPFDGQTEKNIKSLFTKSAPSIDFFCCTQLDLTLTKLQNNKI